MWGCSMIAHSKRLVGLAIITVSFCLFLTVFLSAPAHPQSGGAYAGDVEVISDEVPSQMGEFVVFLFVQVFVLIAIMASYLKFSQRLMEERHSVREHRWSRLRFHH